MLKFLYIPAEILSNHQFVAVDKIILSYFNLVAQNGKAFFGTIGYLANALGLDEKFLTLRLNSLNKVGIIHEDSEGSIRLCLTLPELKVWRFSGQKEEEVNNALVEGLKAVADSFRRVV